MKYPGYYSTGEFAKKAHTTKKTLRYYDEKNILKPSFLTEKGARFYSDNDFAKLQQILFLKYLSFSLEDIKEMTVRSSDQDFWKESLAMQTSLMEEKLQQFSLMKDALVDAQKAIEKGEEVDWSSMLDLVNQNEMEQKLKNQYLNSSNISARITLHRDYSENKEDWFSWLYRQCEIKPGMRILELGCGDASFWLKNKDKLPGDISVVLTDISDGIVREASHKVASLGEEFQCKVMDAHELYADEESFDLVIANHLLFYCDDLKKVLKEVKRVLKPSGVFCCSTYSSKHMQEVSGLVSEFDDRIALAAEALYERFGKENGEEILLTEFSNVKWEQYEDCLKIDKPEPLISYILSCHGNQNRYIVDRYHDFYSFVKKKTDKTFVITKDAGVFVARK